MPSPRPPERILVIAPARARDFLGALPEMAAIRKQYLYARITMLVPASLSDLASRSGYADEIRIDPMTKFYELDIWLPYLLKLRRARFDHVYNLQQSLRSRLSLRLTRLNKKTNVISGREAPDLSWLTSDIDVFGLKTPYILCVPGADGVRAWPPARYGALALKLKRAGIHAVLLGHDADRAVIQGIRTVAPDVTDLSGRTSLADIASLAKGALAAVGSNTTPMHLMAMTHLPVVIVADTGDKPPTGSSIVMIQADDPSAVSVEDVFNNLPVKK